MNSFEDFERDLQERGAYRRQGCGVGKMLATLKEADVARVKQALADETLSSAALNRALRSRVAASVLPGAFTLNRHRRGECQCDTD